MMRVMIVAAASESSGALTILKETYEDAKNSKDQEIQWIFLLGTLSFEEKENVKIFKSPWVKKSWFHRLFFDNFFAPFLAKRYHVDAILSLQNSVLPFLSIPQALNVHQSLPFSEHRFSFFSNPRLWVYQNIIGKLIVRSIKKADFVFFPTKWVRQECISRTGVEGEKIEVIPPKINIAPEGFFIPSTANCRTFFYPASHFEYKNHDIVIQACKILKQNLSVPFKVLFTLNGQEDKNIVNLFEETKKMKLPVNFIGNISQKEVFAYYQKSVLIFPSYIEAFGLPLLESRLHKGIILAANTLFSHEILDGYENAYFFEPFNAHGLAEAMESIISGKFPYIEPSFVKTHKTNIGVLERFLEITCEKIQK